jgi:LDH2 family malate/lactate/ureidoglycolate dehydrogenase
LSEEIYVDQARLRRLAEQALERVGVPPAEASVGADALVEADLRGVETHGVQLLSFYVSCFRQGGFNPQPDIRVVSDTPAVAILDGDAGMGHIVSAQAMLHAMDKARDCGVGVVVVHNSNHSGMMAYHAMMALQHDMIGWALTNGGRVLAPWGSADKLFGNNPQAFAIPTGQELPIVVDMAHSVAAGGKIVMAARRGQRIPLGWGLDKDGQPTDDPHEVLDSGSYCTMGGVKGYCLAVVMEVLAGGLSGGLMTLDFAARWLPFEPYRTCHFFQAIDIGQFLPLSEFKEKTDGLVRQIKGAKCSPGVDRVYAPGELEFLEKERRLRAGIPIHTSVYRELETLAADLDLGFPQ